MAHRDEAIRALDHAIERLASTDPIDGLSRRMLKATVEHAKEHVEAIQEVKRVRKATETPSA